MALTGVEGAIWAVHAVVLREAVVTAVMMAQVRVAMAVSAAAMAPAAHVAAEAGTVLAVASAGAAALAAVAGKLVPRAATVEGPKVVCQAETTVAANAEAANEVEAAKDWGKRGTAAVPVAPPGARRAVVLPAESTGVAVPTEPVVVMREAPARCSRRRVRR